MLCLDEAAAIGKQHLLLLLQVILKVVERLRKEGLKLQKLGVRIAMYSCHMLYIGKKAWTLASNTPMVNLKHIVYQEVCRPAIKGNGSTTLINNTLNIPNYILGTNAGKSTRILKGHGATTTEVNAISLKYTCRSKIVGNDRADTFIHYTQIHNISFLSVLFTFLATNIVQL
jgi:hypothetical protein